VQALARAAEPLERTTPLQLRVQKASMLGRKAPVTIDRRTVIRYADSRAEVISLLGYHDRTGLSALTSSYTGLLRGSIEAGTT
jgi:hypothetical protein